MKSFPFPAIVAIFLLGATGAGLARDIEHAMGVTRVPEEPRRVVVLTTEGAEALLVLGVTPVGAANGRAATGRGDPWYPHVAGLLRESEPLGEERSINLEQVASLAPDIILGNKQRHEAVYEQLSSIAPTVFSERLRGDWRVNLKLYAKALGRSGQAEEALRRFDARVSRLSEALGAMKSETLSVLRFMPGQIRIYQKDSFSGYLLDLIGIARPPLQQADGFVLRVGKESIPDMDGDRLVHFTYEPGDGEATGLARTVLADPLWQTLGAVKDGKAHAVDDTIWNTAGGVLAANLMLNDIARIYGVGPTDR